MRGMELDLMRALLRAGKNVTIKLNDKRAPDCWEWSGTLDVYGYGLVTSDGSEQVPAHRYFYEVFSGQQIPDGMYACHKCDNPICINPLHIFIGDMAENMADKVKKRRNFGVTRMSREDTLEIYRLYKEGLSVPTLCKKFSKSRGSIVHAIYKRGPKLLNLPNGRSYELRRTSTEFRRLHNQRTQPK